MFGLGIWELLAIFMVVLLLFGAKRLPEIGGSLGKGIREFKDSISEVEGEVKREIGSPPDDESDSSSSASGSAGPPPA
jgi:sec-independent protein translocase protein TatA